MGMFEDLMKAGGDQKPENADTNADVKVDNSTDTPSVEPPKDVIVPQDNRTPEPPVDDTGFFKFKTETPVIDVEKVETSEQLFEMVSKRYGFEVKSNEDILGVIGKVNQYKEYESKYEEEAFKASRLIDAFNSMPPEIASVLDAYYNNKDYKSVLKQVATSGVDYSKSPESYSKIDIIKMYNNISEEDLADMDDKAVSALYESSKKLYNTERDIQATKSKEIADMQMRSVNSLKSSISDSVNHLKSEFPDIGKKYIDNVEKIMKTNLYYAASMVNEDGTWKKDAAMKIAMAEYGADVIKSSGEKFNKELARQVELIKSQTREQLLREKFNDNPPQDSHSGGGVTAHDAIIKSMPFLKKK
jgi:hypothetical protein